MTNSQAVLILPHFPQAPPLTPPLVLCHVLNVSSLSTALPMVALHQACLAPLQALAAPSWGAGLP